MRTIDEAALRKAVTAAHAVDTLRDAFRADGEGRAHVPAVILAARKPGRTRADQITIADLTGVGFQDTAIASKALQLVVS
jgi:ornithine cyclodeaminase/alanine dehydrogenase-like protein (mu-crystallin family)